MEQRKALLIITFIISAFILAVASTTIYVQSKIIDGSICSCFVPIPLLIPFFASIGLMIGSLSYYLFSIKSEKPSIKIIENFLSNDERKIVDSIKDAPKTQARIGKEVGLSRVKVHRLIKKMEEKGIIQKSKYGKVTKISLSDEIKNKFELH